VVEFSFIASFSVYFGRMLEPQRAPPKAGLAIH
jgi:hypothetical protein